MKQPIRLHSLRHIFKTELEQHANALRALIAATPLTDVELCLDLHNLLSQCAAYLLIVHTLSNDAMTSISATLFHECDCYALACAA